MKKILLLSMFIIGPVTAGQYAVQLEASKYQPDLNRYQSLSTHGDLYTVKANSGYIRTRLGTYENISEAVDALEKVHAAGFNDAFIAIKQDTAVVSAMPSETRKFQDQVDNFDVSTLKEWDMLDSEQQQNLAYLDGRLHVKNGDNFTPLSKIISDK